MFVKAEKNKIAELMVDWAKYESREDAAKDIWRIMLSNCEGFEESANAAIQFHNIAKEWGWSDSREGAFGFVQRLTGVGPRV